MLFRPSRSLLSTIFLLIANPLAAAPEGRPNILLIVADDMGWSDLGAFGSEIRTPTLDDLASRGITMTRFYAAPTCSPTRAMLMTGVDSHLAGLGTMEGVQASNQVGSRAYAGQIHNDVVMLPEALRSAGYATLMAGKWHLANEPEQYPHNRGFDRSFALLEGGASHFGDAEPLYRGIEATYVEDGLRVEVPEGFYSSISYTDKMLEYLRASSPDKPFFAYVAYTAPHDPLQVPDDWLDKYAGVYSKGPAVLRGERTKRLAARDLVPHGAKTWSTPRLPAFLPGHSKPWDERTPEEREQAARPMEIYAAMIELMDQQIRRLIDELDRGGRLGNTYVIFMADNGPNGATPLSYPNNTRDWYLSQYSQALPQQGKDGSHAFLGQEWASATAAPFKLFKGTIAEGGIRVPLVVSGPSVASNARSAQVALVSDIPATIYQIAGIDPKTDSGFTGKTLPQGRSMVRNWQSPGHIETRMFALELFGHSAVISDNWKATKMTPPLGGGQWELYDIAKDPGEVDNLAEHYPGNLAELVDYYRAYQSRVGVIPPSPPVVISIGDLFVSECDWFCQASVSIIDTLIGWWQGIAENKEL